MTSSDAAPSNFSPDFLSKAQISKTQGLAKDQDEPGLKADDLAYPPTNSRVNSNISVLTKEYFDIRSATMSICSPLKLEDFIVQPIPEVSPPKWHLAHTTWFFEKFLLQKFVPDYQVFDPSYNLLFNSYYKSLGRHWLQSERGFLSRPSVSEIFEYRKHVDSAMLSLFEKQPLNSEITTLLEIGLQHEMQHQELLLMDIKYILAMNVEDIRYNNDQSNFEPQGDTRRKIDSEVNLETKSDLALKSQNKIGEKFSDPNDWWDFESEGVVEIGHQSQNRFCYDNELPRHKVYQNRFSISKSLVTNSEFLEFINDGGYENSSNWLSKGWDWVEENKIRFPLYWRKTSNETGFNEFTLGGLRSLDSQAAVCHISYYEADAFAKWKGLRLPTEFEFEIFLNGCDDLKSRDELWCWTRSHYSPYPGFKEFGNGLGEYNGKFMCNQFVLRGACVATPVDQRRNSYRNFYEPQQRWMFSGIRLAKDFNENH